MAEGADASSGGPPATTRLRLTIAICTFRRPDRLARLLATLAEQRAEARGQTVDVLVVDNDPDRSARGPAEEYGATYAAESRPGVAYARNAALRLVPAEADALVFFDDDQLPDPGWLAALVACHIDDPTSLWSGPVQGETFPDPPAWARDYWPWRRAEQVDGASLAAAGAGNLLIPRRVLDRSDCGFLAEEFPRVGEDTELTSRLVGAGVSLRYAARAGAHEDVPVDRRTVSWVLDRAAASGATNARLWLLRGQHRLLVRSFVVHVARSAARTGLGVLTRRADLRVQGRRDARVAGAYLRTWRTRRTLPHATG